jgi:hypothetical protein
MLKDGEALGFGTLLQELDLKEGRSVCSEGQKAAMDRLDAILYDVIEHVL